MTASLHFSAKLAQRDFDVTIEVAEGERVAVLGHNGSGKSTLLSLLAGTLRPDSGTATFGDSVLFDLGPGKNTWTAPHRREVSLLAQEALLFPHMSVLQNTAFGPRVKGAPRSEARSTAEHWLEEVDAAQFADRRPGQLSGGQAQRVAIARALAARPRLLLLDEPMAALDVAVAPALRRVLRRVLVDQTTLMVTHDLLDAMLLSQRIVVLEGGRVAEQGPTDQVLQHPRTRFTAGLAGLNLVRGTYRDGGVDAPSGLRVEGTVRAAGATNEVPAGTEAAAAFSPSAVSVFESAPSGSPRNNYAVEVLELEPRHDLITVRARTIGGQVLSADATLQSVHDLDLFPGKSVNFSVKAASVTIYTV